MLTENETTLLHHYIAALINERVNTVRLLYPDASPLFIPLGPPPPRPLPATPSLRRARRVLPLLSGYNAPWPRHTKPI